MIDSEMCSVLSNPVNGIVFVDGMNMKGSIATYVCDSGYMLVGNQQRTCHGTMSNWNGTEPICECKSVHYINSLLFSCNNILYCEL